MGREIKLSRIAASPADRLDHRSREIEHDQAVGAAVDDVKLIAGARIGYAHRPGEHIGTKSPVVSSGLVEFNNLPAAGVSDKQPFTDPRNADRSHKQLVSETGDYAVCPCLQVQQMNRAARGICDGDDAGCTYRHAMWT